MAQKTGEGLASMLETVRRNAQDSGRFGEVSVGDGYVSAAAPNAAEPAEYRIQLDGTRLWVVLQTADRWLSQSIEADLVGSGDSLEDLIDEELVDLGFDEGPLDFEHFRSEEMMYVFRSALPIDPSDVGEPEAARKATQALLAYEAVFSSLGDMDDSDEDA